MGRGHCDLAESKFYVLTTFRPREIREINGHARDGREIVKKESQRFLLDAHKKDHFSSTNKRSLEVIVNCKCEINLALFAIIL